jgi:hypothetical protein
MDAYVAIQFRMSPFHKCTFFERVFSSKQVKRTELAFKRIFFLLLLFVFFNAFELNIHKN